MAWRRLQRWPGEDFMFGMGNGGRSWGRPRRRCMDEEEMESTGLQLQQLKKAARDRAAQVGEMW